MGLPIRRTKSKRGGKWSAKYKKSINCQKPKGFSQKQYCYFGRNGKRTTRKTSRISLK